MAAPAESTRRSAFDATFYGHQGGVNGTASIAIVTDDGASGVVIAMNLRSGADPRLPSLADDALCRLR